MANSALDYLDNLLGKKNENENEKPPASAGGSSALEYLDGLIGSRNQQTTPAAPTNTGRIYPASEIIPQPKVNLEPNQYTTRVGYTDTASSNYSREDILRMLADAKVAQEQEQQRQKQYGNTAAKVENAYTLPEAPIGTPTIGAEGIIKAAEAAAAERKNKLRADLGYRDESGVYSASNAAADYAKISKATGISEDELRTYAKANDMGAQRQAYTALILNGDMSLDEFKNVSRQYNVSDEDAEGLYAYYGIEGLRQKIREAADNPYKMQGQYEIARYVEKQLKDRGYTAYGYKTGKYIMPAEYAEVILRETNAPEGGYTAENLAEYPARALALCAVDVTKNPEWEKEADQIYDILYNNLFSKNDEWRTGGDIWTTVANNIRETARPTAVGIMLGLAKGLGSESIAKLISEDVNEKFDTSYARVSQLAPTATNISNTVGTIGLYTALAYLTGGVASSVAGAGASAVGASAASTGVKLATAGLTGAMTFGSVTALQNLGDYARGNINIAEYGKRIGQSEVVGAATSLASGLVRIKFDKALTSRLQKAIYSNAGENFTTKIPQNAYEIMFGGDRMPLVGSVKNPQTVFYYFTRNMASGLAGSGAFIASNALVTGQAPTPEQVAYQFAFGFVSSLVHSFIEAHSVSAAQAKYARNIEEQIGRIDAEMQRFYKYVEGEASTRPVSSDGEVSAGGNLGMPNASDLIVEIESLRRYLVASVDASSPNAVNELAVVDYYLAGLQETLAKYVVDPSTGAPMGDYAAPEQTNAIPIGIEAAGNYATTEEISNVITSALDAGITEGAITPADIVRAESVSTPVIAPVGETLAPAPAQISPDNTIEQNLAALAQTPVTAETSEISAVSPAENTSEGNFTSAEINARNAEITAPRTDTARSWEIIGKDFGENGQRAFTEAYNPEFTSGELDTVGRVFTAFYNAGKNNAGVFSVPESVRASVNSIYANPNDATAMEAAAYTAGINDARLTTDARNDIIVSQETEGGNTYGRQGRDLRVPRVSVRESVQSTREQGGRVSGTTGENQEGRIDSRRGAESGRNGEQNARRVQEVQAGQKVSPKQLGLKYGTDKQNTVVTPSNETLKTANRHGVKVIAVKGALEMRGDDGKTFRVNGASFVDPETGEHTMVVQSDNPKYAERQIVLHEATHEELRQGRVSRQEVHDTINELANSEEEVWELFNAYAREYGETYTEKQILDEIFCDAKAAMDRWGVKGAKKAMNSIRRAAGKVYEASRTQAEQSESSGNDAAMSRSDDRMNNPGEIRNGFYNALSRTEWRSYYQAIADKGYLTAKVGEYAVIPVGDKVVVSQKQRITNTTQDFQTLAVWKVSFEQSKVIADEVSNFIERSGINENDTQRAVKFTRGLLEKYEGIRVFDEYNGEYFRYAYDGSEGEDGRDIRDVSRTRISKDAGTGIQGQDQQDIREGDGLRVSDADNGGDEGASFSREDSTGRELSEGQQEYFKDSKIRDDEGRLQVVYHGTEADFTVFDTSVQGGKNGEAEGFGIYVTPSKAVTEHYGGRQMEMYANITKPARSDAKTIGVTKLAKLIESTAKAEAKTLVEEEGYDTISDALKDTWISNYVNTYDMPINVAYTEVAQWILGAESGDMGVVQEVMAGMGIRDYEDAMDFYREHLVPVTGFDGFATAWENRETGNKVPIYLAFKSSQLKNVNNLNPTESDDIRFSPEEGVNADLAAEFKALQRENAALRERLAAAKGQLKRTEQPTVRSDDVRKVARSVIKRYDSNANTDYVAQKMEDLGNLIVRGSDEKGDATYTRIKEAASDIMYDIIAGSDSVYDADVIESHKRIRDTLRTTKLYVSPSERADAALDSDSYEQFRKKNFGTLNLTSDPKALRVDVFYQELVGQYPWMFDRDITSQGDMLREMVDVANAPLTPSYNIAEEAEVEADDLLWRLMGEEVRQVETFADKAARKQAQAVAHENNKLNAARDKIAALKEEVAAEKAKKEALRKQKNRIIEEIKRKHSAEREDARERKERREAEDRLLGMLRRVNNTKLSTPNRAWFEKYFGDIYTVAKHLTGNKLATAQDLQNKYAELKDNDPDFIGSQRLEEDLAAILDKQKDVASMTDEEIGDYTYVLMEFLHQVQEGNKMTRIADRTDVRMQAYNVMSNVIATKGVPASGIVKQIQDATVTNALDALRAVRRYTGYNDSDPLYLRTRELAEGQRAADMYTTQAKAAFSNLLSNKKFVRFFTGPHAAEIEIHGTDANTNESVTLKITPALRTGLYLNNQNDDNRRHITYGGVIIPDIELLKKGKISEAFARGTRVKFTPKEMTAITSGMTKEELDFARLTNSYFGETSPRAISEVYEELHGVPPKMVGAGYYPLKVADGWTRGNADTIDINAMAFDSPNDIGSPGWLKERKESIAPIYLFPADMVVNRSINDHGRYVGLAIPADNFNKLWEAKLYKKETRYNKLKGLEETYFAPDRALNDVIAGKWGTRAKNNINSFFNQILGRESRMRDTRFGRFRSRYARAVLELNPSVALKQMPSGIAAAAVVGYAPLAKAVNPALKIDTSFIDKMTASYLIRKEGYSQQELGELAQRGKKLPPALSWIIGADLATTGMLKRAAAFYVRDNMKELEVGSDAYKKAVVEVYDNIISETQPTYDVIYRANVLRSTSEITRALNMFRTQPFKNFNILYDALGNLQAKRNAYHEANRWATDDEQSQRYAEEAKAAYHDAKKRAVWAFTSQAASGMLISLIMAGWDMLRGKKKKYADEDGEVTFLSFLKGLGLNFASTGAGMIPYGGVLLEGVESIVDAVSGDDIFDTTMYGFSVPEVELMNDTASGVVNLVRSLRAALVAEEGADWEKMGRSLYNATEQIAQFMGIPLQNARKTVEVMARQVFKAEGKYVGEYMALRMQSAVDSNKKAYYDLLYKAYKDDAEQYKTIYDNLIDNGLSENAIKSAMETRMKKAEGAANVDELSSRYLNPKQQREYDSVTSRVKRSEVWSESGSAGRNKLNELAYQVVTQDGWKDYQVVQDNNLNATEYILYKLALDIVDKPDKNGKYGSETHQYTDTEKELAVKKAKQG